MGESIIDIFEQSSFDHNTIFTGGTSPDDLFSILDTFKDVSVEAQYPLFNHFGQSNYHLSGHVNQEWMRPETVDDARKEKRTKVGKKRKLSSLMGGSLDAPQKINSHIAVERNRRKQMNEHLSVLRSLMPCFYVKRGDQASIIGGVVDYIKELQLVLQSLEVKKQRKICNNVISPRSASSTPRLPPQSPIKPLPFVPKLGIPISPRTPLPESPYSCNFFPNYVSNKLVLPAKTAFTFSENAGNISGLELAMASSTSAPAMADVTVEFSGPNVILKTISQRIPGQVLKIVEALESLSLEVLHASISIVDGTLMNSFTIKIGVECDLSAEDLVEEIKHTFF